MSGPRKLRLSGTRFATSCLMGSYTAMNTAVAGATPTRLPTSPAQHAVVHFRIRNHSAPDKPDTSGAEVVAVRHVTCFHQSHSRFTGVQRLAAAGLEECTHAAACPRHLHARLDRVYWVQRCGDRTPPVGQISEWLHIA